MINSILLIINCVFIILYSLNLMTLNEHYQRQLHFNHWANRKMLDHVLGQGVTEGRIYDLYTHCLGAESAWVGRWNGTAPALELWPRIEPERLPEINRQHFEAYSKALAETYDPSMKRSLAGPTGQLDMALMDIIEQIILHGHYHRGQMNTLLRQAGKEPILIGFFGFVREGH